MKFLAAKNSTVRLDPQLCHVFAVAKIASLNLRTPESEIESFCLLCDQVNSVPTKTSLPPTSVHRHKRYTTNIIQQG